MKMKRLCALAVLLTSSLAGADGVSDLEGQYYAGLNVGAGWGGGLVMKPSIVFGYHHDKNSKFELEVLSDIKLQKSIGASLLANYRFYPDLDIDPVKLYVSGGLGGYLQVIPFGFGGGTGGGDGASYASGDEAGDASGGAESAAIAGTTVSAIYGDEEPDYGDEEPDYGDEEMSMVDKILGSISYKLKVGVDYEITPQIVGAVGITIGGQLSGFKPPIQIPDAIFEVGVRYNF